MWGGENFEDSANDIQLEGDNYLTAELPMRDGGYRERQGIDLNKNIANINGQLTYTGASGRQPLAGVSIDLPIVTG
jgi:hypothetical protein